MTAGMPRVAGLEGVAAGLKAKKSRTVHIDDVDTVEEVADFSV